MNSAILLIGHGSRDDDAVQEFYQLADGFRERFPDQIIATGFLELVAPSINDAVQALVDQGVTSILALPGMLMAGNHAKSDIPKELERQRQKHGISIGYGEELGADDKMIAAARSRIEQAEAQSLDNSLEQRRCETLLMIVGRGSNDPKIIANFNHIADTLQQEMGFKDAAVAYSGISPPCVTTCLEKAKSQGHKRVMLFPYFLFTGHLVKRIHQQTDNFAKQHPDMDIIKAGYFSAHPKVIDTFVQRLEEIPTNHISMS